MLIQVFWRYVLRLGTPWAEEIALYLMVWVALMGASSVSRERKHVSIIVITRRLSPRAAALLRLIVSLLVLVFLAVLLVEGLIYALRFWDSRSPATGISRTWAYLALPVGSLLMIGQTLATLGRTDPGPRAPHRKD